MSQAHVGYATMLEQFHPVEAVDFTAAAERAGFRPTLRVGNGGLDANWLVRHGIPTVTFGAGQNLIHTVDEFVDVPEFLKGCRMALALATGPAAPT